MKIQLIQKEAEKIYIPKGVYGYDGNNVYLIWSTFKLKDTNNKKTLAIINLDFMVQKDYKIYIRDMDETFTIESFYIADDGVVLAYVKERYIVETELTNRTKQYVEQLNKEQMKKWEIQERIYENKTKDNCKKWYQLWK